MLGTRANCVLTGVLRGSIKMAGTQAGTSSFNRSSPLTPHCCITSPSGVDHMLLLDWGCERVHVCTLLHSAMQTHISQLHFSGRTLAQRARDPRSHSHTHHHHHCDAENVAREWWRWWSIIIPGKVSQASKRAGSVGICADHNWVPDCDCVLSQPTRVHTQNGSSSRAGLA